MVLLIFHQDHLVNLDIYLKDRQAKSHIFPLHRQTHQPTAVEVHPAVAALAAVEDTEAVGDTVVEDMEAVGDTAVEDIAAVVHHMESVTDVS